MADRISPPNKPVGKADGIPQGSSHSTITTPDPTYGRYFGSDKPAEGARGNGSIMGRKK